MLDVRPLVIPAASGLLVNLGGAITYWSVRDTTDSSGSVFQVYDGNSTAGVLMIDVSTTAGESTSEYIHRGHLRFRSGLYFHLASGAVEGSVTAWTGLAEWEWAALLTAADEVG